MGRRVVAQSIVPGILRRDQSKSMAYGVDEADDRMTIDPQFSAVLARTTDKLRIRPHRVRHGDDPVEYLLHTAADCKGVRGSDDRMYVLELMRTTPLDCGARPGPETTLDGLDGTAEQCGEWKPPHGFNLLRHELVEDYCRRGGAQPDATPPADGSDANGVPATSKSDAPTAPQLFNPDAFTAVHSAEAADVVSEDERAVLALSTHLQQVVLPRVAAGMCVPNSGSSPVDGPGLCTVLHAAGVNLRYLGRVAGLVGARPSAGAPERHVQALCVIEMVARSAKHRLRALLEATVPQHAAAAVAHFLNCLLNLRTRVLGRRNPKKAKAGAMPVGYTSSESAGTLWTTLQADVRQRFRFRIKRSELDDLGVGAHTLLRAVCTKVGICVVARAYVWDAAEGATFGVQDILDVKPVVKRTEQFRGAGHQLYAAAVSRARTGDVRGAIEGIEMAIEAFHQVTGPVHESVARCNQMIALIIVNVQGHEQRAVHYQEKAVAVLERVLGPESAETMQAYTQLAQYLKINKVMPLQRRPTRRPAH